MADKLDFTHTNIKAVSSPATGRLEFRDTAVQGLYLRVTANGVKTFSFVGRAKGSSRVERLTIGKYPTIKPEEARRRAKEVAGELAGGTSLALLAKERRGELTLDQLKDEYMQDLRRRTRRPEETERLYRLYIAPHFGARRLSDIRATDVGRWLHALPDQILHRRAEEEAKRRAMKEDYRKAVAARQAGRRRGPDPKPRRQHLSAGRVTGKRAANRALNCLCAMFNWALKPEHALFTGVNPAARHTKFPEVQRDRFLQDGELGRFFEALALETNEEARDANLIKLLSGARRSNVHEMRWSEVDLQAAEWRIPKTKNNDPQLVPLVPEAVEILTERKKTATSVFVFPSTTSKTGHIVSTTKAWRRILERSGLTDLREHDLRRTLGSWQAKGGASLVLIGKSLNQRDPDSTKVYARLDMDPVRESVTRATSAMFEAAGLKAPAEVLQFPPRAVKAPRKSAEK